MLHCRYKNDMLGSLRRPVPYERHEKLDILHEPSAVAQSNSPIKQLPAVASLCTSMCL